MHINLTLIGQMITFALFVWLTMKYVWPPIMKALHDRQEKIATGLAAAEQGERSLELAKREADELIQDAKLQANEVLEQANKRASSIVEEARGLAKQEGHRLQELAKAEIEQLQLKAKADLKNETAVLAISIAEKIIGRKLDQAANNELLDDLIEEVSG